MKKILSVVVVLTLAITLVACGKKNTNTVKEENITSTSESSKTDENNVIESATQEEKVVEEIVETVSEEIVESKEPKKDKDVPDWRSFLKEYEDWVDEYIKITKKYSENPTDFSILGDYTDMLSEMTDWAEKTDEMEKALEDASVDELLEYTNELVRIAAKIAEAAY